MALTGWACDTAAAPPPTFASSTGSAFIYGINQGLYFQTSGGTAGQLSGGAVTISNVVTTSTTTTATLSRTVATGETGTLNGTAGAFTDSASPANPCASFNIPISNQTTPAPTNLAATGGLTRVNLTWTGIAGSATYSVYRSTTSGAETLIHSGVSGTSFADTGLTGGTYYYKVSATLSGSEGALSNEASATASDFTLSANPTVLTVLAGGTTTSSITVTPLGGFSGQVTLSASSTTSGITATTTSAAPGSPVSLPIAIAKTVPSGTYTLTVTGADSTGTVTRTTPIKVTVTSPIPTLTAAGGLTRVNLTWTSVTGNATYTLYRSTASGTETAYKPGLTGSSFSDTGLTGGATFFYKVTATLSGFENPRSNEVSAKVTDFTLSANPTTVTVPAGGSANTLITVNPLGGFSGAVSFSGTASGITASGTAATPSAPATVQISAASSAAPGTYSLTVTGTATDATGSVSHTTTLTVIVVPALAVHVLWTSDATTSPVTMAAATSGQIGGNASVHLSLPLPPGASSPSAPSVTIHEVAAPDASHDIKATNVSLTGSANPLCDPPPGLPAGWTAGYADVAWPLGGRNGPYTITVQGQYTNAAGATVPQPQVVTVDREDLIVASTNPVNPAALLWDPFVMKSVSLSASATSACRATAVVTVNIYTTDDNQNPIRTLSQTLPVGGSGSSTPLTFTWDGTTNVTDPGTGLPAVANKDTYLFKYTVSSPNGDSDCEKSTSLSLSSTTAYADNISDDGKTAVYKVSTL